jgi:broad specificity phosphatase PhoE
MPDHLIVIRSPVTDYERQGRVRGSLDVPPCPEGLAEARAAAAALVAAPPLAIYTAPTACAIEAGRIIGSRCGLTAKPLDLLENLDLGLWQGKLVSEIRRQQPRTFRQWQDDPWSVIPPEGELLEEARVRVELALERIFKRHRTGRVAVVVPPPLDALVRWLVSAEPLGDLWQPAGNRPTMIELPVAAQWRANAAPIAPPPLAGATPVPRADVGTR